jgi:hypothetical protein
MQDRRLLLRTILKTMIFSAVLILLLVFINSLFLNDKPRLNTNNSGVLQLVHLNVSELQPGQIMKTRWKGKEVAVLYRQNLQSEIKQSASDEDLHPSLHAFSRSQQPEYFVYFNVGDSGNCPLFYSQGIFKDICTANEFDESGRGIKGAQGNSAIQIPPHHFIGNEIVIGLWGD